MRTAAHVLLGTCNANLSTCNVTWLRSSGSLLVTSPTGRGIPVIDFIALNEQAVTMRTVLEFFKLHNPDWPQIKTVVIDKDFVEWQVLEECFPTSVVLLCQYHAMTYWKKLVQRRKYELTTIQRDDVESLFIQMMYRCVSVHGCGAVRSLTDSTTSVFDCIQQASE